MACRPASPTIVSPAGRPRRVAGPSLTLGVLLWALVVPGAPADQGQEAEVAGPLRADSAAPYIHRLTLYDHDGVAISPQDEPARPYSPRATCGKCHDYATISRGWHFNAPDRGVPPGRPGEPWFLMRDGGTLVAVSGRGWPQTVGPAEAGLSNWQFVLRFGHHSPGGGFGEPSDEQLAASGRATRWQVSGRLEIDCMFCHSADQQHDPAEAARQIELENFRWAPTVALGLGVVRGSARSAPDDWDPLLPPDPDHPEQAGPMVIYNPARFDADDRVFFNITRRPSPRRCQFCHFAREVGQPPDSGRFDTQDVHLFAGLICVDCHRNRLDHMIIRGYPAEAAERGLPALAAFTCEGCHLGTLDGVPLAGGGLYGAPHPEHPGLPPVHFEKLTCTACHSGPQPGPYARRFQTALAHGLGLATRDRHEDDPPRIIAPIFAKSGEETSPGARTPGRIGPYRLVWNVGGSQGYYRWPIAHNVRPASQALGAGGCTDCHAEGAPLFFGLAAAADDELARPVRMYELHGASPNLARGWATAFRLRSAFKWLGFGCLGLMGLVLLHYLLAGIGALTRRFG